MLLKESFGFSNDQGPLCFLVLECLFQNVDREKSQVSSLFLDTDLDLIECLHDGNVFNLRALDALGENVA